jgi:tetratricopeptide (TPR) repeat protein
MRISGKLHNKALLLVALAAVAGFAFWKVSGRKSIQQAEERLLAANSAALDAHSKGEAAYAQGDLQNALRGFETAARLEPRSALALMNTSLAESRLGNSERALAMAQAAARRRPDWGVPWVRLAHLHADANRLPQAGVAAERAMKMAPDLADAWLAGAHVALLRGDLKKSRELARKATQLAPDSAPAWLALGEAWLKGAGNEGLSEAIRAFEKANTLQETLFGRRLLGEGLRRSGRLPEAIAALESAVKLDSNDPTSAYQLGLALREAGRVKEADEWAARSQQLEKQRYRLAALARKAEQAPDDIPLQLELGTELRKRGDRAGAMRAYQHVLKLEPENSAARQSLAALEAGDGAP